MNLLKGLKKFFFGKDQQDAEERAPEQQHRGEPAARDNVRKPAVAEPVLTNAHYSNGGVQGLRWFEARLRVDADGDCATEFLEEDGPAGSILQTKQELKSIWLEDVGSTLARQGLKLLL